MAEPDPALRPEPLPEDADRALRPQTLDEFIGQARGAGQPRGLHRERAAAAAQAMDHTLFYGPPGLGKTTLAQIMARELGVNFRMTSGPVLARAGRSGGDPDQPRRARRALHRRDPPAEPGGGGDPLPGARGLPARPRHRRGAGGAHGADRAAAVHAGRRDDAARAADDAAARPVRHPDPARVLRRSTSWSQIVDPGGAAAAGRGDAGRGARDRAAGARHAAHRRAAAAAGGRLRHGRGRRAGDARASPTGR